MLATLLAVLALPRPFPIAVWLQDPANAVRYRQAGINLYVGLWQGPTEAQLSDLKAAGMPVICEQNAVGLAHRGDPTITGWMHQDEPDNAQAKPGGGYGPCIPPQRIVDDYRRLKGNDPTRPVMLNLGQGVANDAWIGRGEGAKLSDYLTYVQGADIVSFDVYPVAGLGGSDLRYVPKGVDRLRKWTAGKKPVWSCIETGRIDGDTKPTPAQVRSETWMAIIHGARGLIYFVHQFKPTFDEHALLDDPEMLASVSATNQEIQSLARVLDAPTIAEDLSPNRAVNYVAKSFGRDRYLFACNMTSRGTAIDLAIPKLPKGASAKVIGENRTERLGAGTLHDTFGPYAIHLYKIGSP